MLPEMTLPLPEAVPPMVFAVAPAMSHPLTAIAEIGGAVTSVPMRLPSTTLPDVPLSTSSTPYLLPEMTLAAPAAVPPIVFAVALVLIITPPVELPSLTVPVMSVPMRLPSTTLPLVPGPANTRHIAVPGDDVGRARGRAAHRVRRGAAVDVYAGIAVAETGRAILVGADQIAQHQVARHAGAEEFHVVVGIAGNDVGRSCGRAAHHVRRGAVLDDHAVGGVAEIGGAVDVGADQVAQHHVAARPACLQIHAMTCSRR